jgi:glyoxylase-like metal-dependent hydrolase (beta-lactamase superfamily II)
MIQVISIALRITLLSALVFYWKPDVLSLPAAAADFETKPVDGLNNVFTFRYKDRQAMFVVTDEGVIATDPISHDNIAIAVKYVSEIRKITPNPIKFVIYSHSGPERSGGGQPFKDEGATFIAHAKAKQVIEQGKDAKIIVPDQFVEEGKPQTITLGGTDVEIRDFGRNYSNDMLVLILPKEKVLFAVDFIPIETLPAGSMPNSWIPGWEYSLKAVYDNTKWDKLVPGAPYAGGRLGTKKDVQNLRDYLTALSAKVKERVDDCWIVARNDIKLPDFEKFANYKPDLPFNIDRYCYYWTTQYTEKSSK